MLEIKIKYQLESREWFELSVEPRKYFWRDPNDDNTPSYSPLDQPDHSSNGIELVPVAHQNALTRLVTDVIDTETSERFLCEYSYWRGPEHYICLSSHWENQRLTRELILAGEFPFKSNGHQSIRIMIEDNSAELTMNHIGWGNGGDQFGYNILKDTGDA